MGDAAHIPGAPEMNIRILDTAVISGLGLTVRWALCISNY